MVFSSFFKRISFTILLLVYLLLAHAQDNDSIFISKIYSDALLDSTSYQQLRTLVSKYPKRLCGTKNAELAVLWSKTLMEQMAFDTVYLEKCMVKHWVRDTLENGKIVFSNKKERKIHICTLGGSVGTGNKGILAPLIEIESYQDLNKLSKEKVEGSIVFINCIPKQTTINTFPAYGSVADQRVHAASEAAKYGAKAVIIRSITMANDTFPHTGIMRYDENVEKIPAFAISTADANYLHELLMENTEIKIFLKSNSYELPELESFNVIGEMKGITFPNEIISVGGHLDCWDNSPGAHDDGVGCLQSLEVARLLQAIAYKPQRTFRVVFFMDEEYAQRGGKMYAENAVKRNELHLAAIESDRGGFTPQGFSYDADAEKTKKLLNYFQYLKQYDLYKFIGGYSGVDIQFLKPLKPALIALMTDSQRYFDYHHSAADTFDKVNRREMQLGAAAMTALVYLIDKHGL